MADPGDPHFIGTRWCDNGFQHITVRPAEHSGNDAVAEKPIVAPWPSFLGKYSGIAGRNFTHQFGNRKRQRFLRLAHQTWLCIENSHLL